MTYLIVYSSLQGHTLKICRFCADVLKSAGHRVDMVCVADAWPERLALYDGTLLAAPVYDGQYQPDMLRFAKAHASVLADQPSLFLSVSLAAAGRNTEELADLDRGLAQFMRETSYSPTWVSHVAGAFRFSELSVLKRWALRFVATIQHLRADPFQDAEYTDWTALRCVLLYRFNPPFSEEIRARHA